MWEASEDLRMGVLLALAVAVVFVGLLALAGQFRLWLLRRIGKR